MDIELVACVLATVSATPSYRTLPYSIQSIPLETRSPDYSIQFSSSPTPTTNTESPLSVLVDRHCYGLGS